MSEHSYGAIEMRVGHPVDKKRSLPYARCLCAHAACAWLAQCCDYRGAQELTVAFVAVNRQGAVILGVWDCLLRVGAEARAAARDVEEMPCVYSYRLRGRKIGISQADA